LVQMVSFDEIVVEWTEWEQGRFPVDLFVLDRRFCARSPRSHLFFLCLVFFVFSSIYICPFSPLSWILLGWRWTVLNHEGIFPGGWDPRQQALRFVIPGIW
jgi:hypothetical protein